MGGWSNLQDVVGEEAAAGWKNKIESELSDPAFETKAAGFMANHKDPESGSKALIILGPSAAGKSHIAGATEVEMPNNAVILDGAFIRDCSERWEEAKALAHSNNLEGFADLFQEYFKPHISKVKKRITDTIIRERSNIVVLDTASDFKKTSALIKRLVENGYSLRVVAVYASKEICEKRGRSREKFEGKRYSSKNWFVSIQSIIDAQDLLVALGLDDEVPILNNDVDDGCYEHMSMDSLRAALNEGQSSLAKPANLVPGKSERGMLSSCLIGCCGC